MASTKPVSPGESVEKTLLRPRDLAAFAEVEPAHHYYQLCKPRTTFDSSQVSLATHWHPRPRDYHRSKLASIHALGSSIIEFCHAMTSSISFAYNTLSLHSAFSSRFILQRYVLQDCIGLYSSPLFYSIDIRGRARPMQAIARSRLAWSPKRSTQAVTAEGEAIASTAACLAVARSSSCKELAGTVS